VNPSIKSYEVVLRDVEAKLRTGELSLGDRLSGERTLAQEYGISRASVRDAIRVLNVMGVVRSSTGSGPDSGTQIIAEPSVGLSNALRLHMASSSLPDADVIEARILLETWGARGAAVRCAAGAVDPARVDALGGILAEMEQPGIERERFHLLDAQFHTDLTALAGNVAIESFMGSMREAVRHYVMESVALMGDWDAVADGLRQEHRDILAAVIEGRADDAARLVEAHIRGFDRLRQQRLG
jgi:GntR family transcriptional repressor for pyruvate dehydrogenase complex